ncbi:hypothetical protein KCP73_04750 [Salmonella enterica subsp. enterica]|nr:hypothetical protein KCP73_04750 [Salmonella enterica subsp. enterica]
MAIIGLSPPVCSADTINIGAVTALVAWRGRGAAVRRKTAGGVIFCDKISTNLADTDNVDVI